MEVMTYNKQILKASTELQQQKPRFHAHNNHFNDSEKKSHHKYLMDGEKMEIKNSLASSSTIKFLALKNIIPWINLNGKKIIFVINKSTIELNIFSI
jgi:hypothetical protein